MPNFRTLDDLNAHGKRVLVRLDLNLPIQNGQVTDFTRLERSLPTLKELVAAGAKVIVLSHLGRPKGIDKSLTLAPIAHALKKTMAPTPVFFCEAFQGAEVEKAIKDLSNGEILLLENIRFAEGEEKNDPGLAKTMARWADVYVNDAFSAAHRAHASTEGVAHYLPAYAGRLMEEELKALDLALGTPKRPLMAIVGGAKVSTKLPLLENLLDKVDLMVIGGAMANTFLAAKDYDVGASLYEPDFLNTARDLLGKGCEILLPQDVVVSESLKSDSDPKFCGLLPPASAGVAMTSGQRHCEAPEEPRQSSSSRKFVYENHEKIRLVSDVQGKEKIFDIGPLTCQQILEKLKTCKSLLWNGPLGVFETPPFDKGTVTIAQGAADLTRKGALISVAGGGDTVAALAHAKVLNKFTYVSTAGGAFLEWLEGKPLPGVLALSLASP